MKVYGFEVVVHTKQKSFGAGNPYVLRELGGTGGMQGELSSVESPAEVGAYM